MNRWLWICPMLAVLLSVTIFLYWGWSLTTVVLIALAIVCPSIMIWGVIQIRKLRAGNLKADVKQGGGKRS